MRQAALQALETHGQEIPPRHLQQPRLRSRSWQEPPSLQAVREDPREDCHSESSSLQEDLSTAAESGESSRQSSEIFKRDAGYDAASSSTFTMSVCKLHGQQLGIDVDYTQRDRLKVLYVHPGIVDDWNKKQEKWNIRTGDHIVEVNGRRGTAKELMGMLKACSDNGLGWAWLEVMLQREARKCERFII